MTLPSRIVAALAVLAPPVALAGEPPAYQVRQPLLTEYTKVQGIDREHWASIFKRGTEIANELIGNKELRYRVGIRDGEKLQRPELMCVIASTTLGVTRALSEKFPDSFDLREAVQDLERYV